MPSKYLTINSTETALRAAQAIPGVKPFFALARHSFRIHLERSQYAHRHRRHLPISCRLFHLKFQDFL